MEFHGLLNGTGSVPGRVSGILDKRVRKRLHNPVQIVRPYIREGMVTADIGCGLGMFSFTMARMVGPEGKVYAVDIHEKLILSIWNRLQYKKHAAIRKTLIPYVSRDGALSFSHQLDFALAFWMLHETVDRNDFLGQIYRSLKDDGMFLLSEPKIHVSAREWNNSVDIALANGFTILKRPRIFFSQSVLLAKSGTKNRFIYS